MKNKYNYFCYWTQCTQAFGSIGGKDDALNDWSQTFSHSIFILDIEIGKSAP